MNGAYDDIRIIDFTQGIAGPMACGLLAQHGAEVIKVESPAGDRMSWHPGYVAWNCNKSRLALDLEAADGLAAARRLIATADVAAFDFAPGVLERLELDGATLTKANVGLIHVWMPPYGTAGRWAQLPPEDSLLAAVSCASFAQASWEDVPVHLVTPQLGYGHAITAAGAIGAAIYERRRSGLGQQVLCSGVHGCAAVRSGGAIRAAGLLRMGAGKGARGGSPNYRLYQCADGEWLFLGTLTMPFFLRALEAMDLLDILAWEGVDGDIANLQRPPHNEAAIRALDERFVTQSREDWLTRLHGNGVPAGPVGERTAWFAGEQVAANEMRVELIDPVRGAVSVPGVSSKLTGTPGAIRSTMIEASLASLPGRDVAPVSDRPDLGPPSGGPLAALRILDMGAVIAGPFGPTVLANYGADVIKVEPPEGDSLRTAALGFAGWNRGKRGVVFDLKSAAGLQAFYDLVRTTDVVVDNFRRGVNERLKIDYAILRAINPGIITVSVMGYGPGGPLGGDPGFDPILQARSGMMAAQGGDDEPVFHTIPVNDEASGLMSAFTTITALNARERTGEGQHCWTSLANQSVVCQSGELTLYEGRPLLPLGGRDCAGERALHGLYECSDGWVAIAARTGEQVTGLAAVLGIDESSLGEKPLAEPRLGTAADTIARAVRARETLDLVAELLAHGVPAAPAIRPEATRDDEWLNANGFWEDYDLPGTGEVSGVRAYAEFSRTPGGFRYPAPPLGAHTAQILAELQVRA
jgi:crotonobetainyl-CoA:carnitine CoA-transferase CaiB-like acyl-CoA transferase